MRAVSTIITCWAFFPGLVLATVLAEDTLDFNRDIRPILSEHCFACHGPDEASREADLRLDNPDWMQSLPLSTEKPDDHQLLSRIMTYDPEQTMPPTEFGKPLSGKQQEMLRTWLAQGAHYSQHWAFVEISDSSPPTLSDSAWIKNEIDCFILAQLDRHGLHPSPAAVKESLVRRVTLDLTGLPPTVSEVDAFLADETNAAYEKLVDRLLSSPRYGEHMAVDWLDAARFADSNGYQVDRDRELWPWRDWVIKAFNQNMAFDQFTIEQLAGDLLPSPTLDQLIATGFHRNHMLNEEGGIIAEEFLAEYTADRVETTAAVWLGQTFNCARCHDHKYDPFTQRDFYALKAFFHNVPELGVGEIGKSVRRNAPPFVELPAPEIQVRLKRLNSRLSLLHEDLSRVEVATTDQFDELALDAPPEVRAAAALPRSRRSATEQSHLKKFLALHNLQYKKLIDEAEAIEKQIAAAELEIPTAWVMEEMAEPRPTFVLIRGAYDQPGEQVLAQTPAALPPMSSDLPRDRLGLARWLVGSQNPLTARVVVNRFWQRVFGRGLVATSEDFGSQGAQPTHPELLDWLANDFMVHGWNVKRLMKHLVMSATYRQHAQITPAAAELDPNNLLLARAPRFRFPAEMIRDQALAVSGLLTNKLGGSSVKPYHPPGLYEQVTAGRSTNTYLAGTGADLYRRSLYTYWKRSVPHPAMLLFDAPFRESCTLKRSRSNTPLQALNLMNDPTYVEAARFLAQRMMVDGGATIDERLEFGFRTLLARSMETREAQLLRTVFDQALTDFSLDTKSAQDLVTVGNTERDFRLPIPEHAAYTLVASLLLNLDETITK